MNLLDTILQNKREEIAVRKKACPEGQLREMPLFDRQPLSLRRQLAGRRPGVIAEIKRASPSRGIIRRSFDPVAIARQYARAGASAISVLTDAKFFHGSLAILSLVRGVVDLPLLRKDFILDAYQLTEAKAYGADAVLLIAAALKPETLLHLHSKADALGLECLVEVHTEEEIAALAGGGCKILGINNRDLTTFTTDLSVSERLRPLLPPETVVVSESGISSGKDLRRLAAAGIHAVLIGEGLMRHENPGDALAGLLKEAGGSVA